MTETMASPTFRGNYFSSRGYLTTDVKTGVTRNRAGTRVLALTSDFLLGLRSALETECGPAADMVFKSCGRSWGRRFAVRLEKELGEFYGQPLAQFPLAVFEACLREAFGRHGWGCLTIDWAHHDRGLLTAELNGAILADVVGKAARPLDVLAAGVLAGLFAHFAGEDLDCVQTECPACGGTTSRFIIGLTSRLAEAGEQRAAGKSHDQILAELLEQRA